MQVVSHVVVQNVHRVNRSLPLRIAFELKS